MKNYELNIDGEKYKVNITAHGLRQGTLTEGCFLEELKKEPGKLPKDSEKEVKELCFDEVAASMGTPKYKRSIRRIEFNKPLDEDLINYDKERTQLWFTDSSNKVCEIIEEESGNVVETIDLKDSVFKNY